MLSDQTIGFVGYIPAISGIVHYNLLIYTMYYYTIRGRFLECLPSFCIFGIMNATYAYYLSILGDKMKEWFRLIIIPGKHIYRDNRQLTNYNRICEESLSFSIKAYIIKMMVIIISFVGATIGPFYRYLNDGTLVTFYALKLPYYHDDLNKEFMINAIWQFGITIFGGVALFFMEGILTLIDDTVTVSSKLSQLEFEELSDFLENESKTIQKSRKKLTDIFMKIAYFDEIIQFLGDILYLRNFLAPPTFSISIAISVYSQKVMDYPAGYGLAVVSYIQMAVMCVLGQHISDRNDRLVTAIYDFKWYLLPKDDQKDVLHMLLRLQNEVSFTIGPFEELNFETLKNLCQKVYSFLMFLSRFTE
ncbi:odorant receptor 67d-like [Contarinia nasturtii]|uniref:odorant receptor 67d-like n=1 Tax=Contarinia nasturtii TaxID=265458 RepID=UPI0012D3F2E7|nr:odorant receptor 67d-like [Contarinia nasturtii]